MPSLPGIMPLPRAALPSLDAPALHRTVDLKAPPVPGADADQVLHVPEITAGTDLIARNAGDASSVLSIAGAALLFAPGTVTQHIGRPVIAASIVAGAVDTGYEVNRWMHHDKDSGLRATLYAATGLLPSSSLMWASLVKGGMHRTEAARLVALGANLTLIGYEAATRSNKIRAGKEDTSGYLAVGAALSGVIAKAR